MYYVPLAFKCIYGRSDERGESEDWEDDIALAVFIYDSEIMI